MVTTLTVRDETTTGKISDPFTLEFLNEEISVEELIRERVYQEVKDYNASVGEVFRGLIQPNETEVTLNGFKLKRRRRIEWKPQFETAKEAFANNQILVLIDNNQAQDLADTFTIGPKTEVTFLKLIPLVGG